VRSAASTVSWWRMASRTCSRHSRTSSWCRRCLPASSSRLAPAPPWRRG
jgi:hypothetical protein